MQVRMSNGNIIKDIVELSRSNFDLDMNQEISIADAKTLISWLMHVKQTPLVHRMVDQIVVCALKTLGETEFATILKEMMEL